MKKLWYSFSDDELLTIEEQKIQSNQEYMSIGFWIGYIVIVGSIVLGYLISKMLY